MLLEIVLALALFVATAMVVLGSLVTCTQALQRMRLEAVGTDLAVSVISELQMGLRDPGVAGSETMPEPFEDWTLELSADAPLEALGGPQVVFVTVTVHHSAENFSYSLTQMFPSPAVVDQERIDDE